MNRASTQILVRYCAPDSSGQSDERPGRFRAKRPITHEPRCDLFFGLSDIVHRGRFEIFENITP